MADSKGQPIHGPLTAPATPAARAVDPDRPPVCVACGQFHGSVGVHIACLGNTIVRLRAELARRGGGGAP